MHFLYGPAKMSCYDYKLGDEMNTCILKYFTMSTPNQSGPAFLTYPVQTRLPT